MASEKAWALYPDGCLLGTADDLREAFDRGVRAEIVRRNSVFKNRVEEDQADIIGWFACHNSEAIRVVVEAGQAIIQERADDGVTS